MPIFVSLYWGGRLINVPGMGMAYDPPRAKGSIAISTSVSYHELVRQICEKIKIDMNEHTIELTWRHVVVFGVGFTYVGTAIDEESMVYMFKDAANSGHLEIIVEFVPNVENIGTSTRNEPIQNIGDVGNVMDFGDVGNVENIGDVENVENIGDVGDVEDDGSDNSEPCDPEHINPGTPVESDDGGGNIDFSAESGGDLSDDEMPAVTKPYVPAVRRSQLPVPQYVHTGLPLFHSLPCTAEGYIVPNLEGNAANTWYWDDRKPTHIGLGTKFECKLHLKTAMTLWHLNIVRQYRVDKSNLKRWHAVCKSSKKCNWEVGATLRKHDGLWEIRKWVNKHNCLGNRNSREHPNISSTMIALCIRHLIEDDINYKPSAIQKFVQDTYKVECSYKKAWYARRQAIELIYGGWEDSFKDLPRYMAEIQSQNPGTIVEWKHNEGLSDGPAKVFRYVFWAFGPAIEAFQLAKPVLTVDGTHLRGRLKGKLLIAVGFDANKKCLPVAYAIVDEETNDSWEWFMGLIRVHVTKYDREVCIISDRHASIIRAMDLSEWNETPPVGHHRFCLVHVRKNVLQKCKGIKVKILVWSMGIATEIRKYLRRLRALEFVSNDAVKYLQEIGQEKWSLAFDEGRRWGETTTNMVECYNNVLRAARELPIRACIDLTFWRTVDWWSSRNTDIEQCETMLTPWAMKKINENDVIGQGHCVKALNRIEGIYHVRTRYRKDGKGGNYHTVEYMASTCTCGKWQMWRVPCSHAAAVVRERGDDIFDLVHQVYHKDVWHIQYAGDN